MDAAALVPKLLPLLDGVVDKLEVRSRGWPTSAAAAGSLQALARAFPGSRFVGFDPSHHACHDVRVRVHHLHTVQFHETYADDLPQKRTSTSC